MHHLTLKRTATIYAFFKFHEADCHQPCWYNRYFFIGTGMGSLSTFPFVRCSFPMDLRIVRLQRSIRGWGSATRKKRKKRIMSKVGKKFSPSIYIYQYCKHSHANSILKPIASAQLHKLSTFSYWQIFLFFHDYRNQSIHLAVVIFFWPGNFIPL